jgi:hypothetical protein
MAVRLPSHLANDTECASACKTLGPCIIRFAQDGIPITSRISYFSLSTRTVAMVSKMSLSVY